MIQKFYDKLTQNILTSANFNRVRTCIQQNPDLVQKYLFSVNNVEDIKEIDIKNDPLLSTLFNYTSDSRGDTRGKGELLIVFLVATAHFGNDSDLIINDELRQIKAYLGLTEIAFGVENTWVIYKFGMELIKLFINIYQIGEASSEFRKEFPYWFTFGGRGMWVNKYKVLKFIGGEISSNNMDEIFVEIPKLKGIIDHNYVVDINQLRIDIKEFNEEFNKKHIDDKIIMFVNEQLHSVGENYKLSSITQNRIKMRHC